MRNRVISLVSNNIATDQRLLKVGSTLKGNGFDFELTGTTHQSAPDLSHIPFKTERLPLIFHKNFTFYAEMQMRFLLALLKKDKKNIILQSNDLDTLYPARTVSRLLNIPLVVDFHEIFSEMPTLKEGSYQKKVWTLLEKNLLPGLRHTYTVSSSYAGFFQEKYGIQPEIIMNVPFLEEEKPLISEEDSGKKRIIYQGAMNFSRGIDKMLQAMQFIDNVELWLAGDGPYLPEFQKLTLDLEVSHKVKFLGRINPSELKDLTRSADLGLSLEEDNGLSYRFALPNKFFDYIHAEIPVLGSPDLVEMKDMIRKYEVGDVIENHSPEHIAEKISKMLQTGKEPFAEKVKQAKQELNWQKQEEKLLKIYKAAANE